MSSSTDSVSENNVEEDWPSLLHASSSAIKGRKRRAVKQALSKVVDVLPALSRYNYDLAAGDQPAILAGDFNLLPDSAAFPHFRQMGLHDLITHHGIADTRTALYEKSQRFADYMLVSADLLTARFDVPATPVVSDHRALVLDF